MCRHLESREPAVRIRVQDAADIDGVVAFLEETDYVAERIGPNTIEVSRLSSVRHNHRLELDLGRAIRAGLRHRTHRSQE
jgi:hypothetical protein